MSKLGDLLRTIAGVNKPVENQELFEGVDSPPPINDREVLKKLLHDFFAYMKSRHHTVLYIFLLDTVEESIEAYLDSKIAPTDEAVKPE